MNTVQKILAAVPRFACLTTEPEYSPTKDPYRSASPSLKSCCGMEQKIFPLSFIWASQVALVVKNLPAKAGDTRESSLITESGRSLERGNGTPLQYSCQKNPMHRGVWQATYSPWHRKESDTTEYLSTSFHPLSITSLCFS